MMLSGLKPVLDVLASISAVLAAGAVMWSLFLKPARPGQTNDTPVPSQPVPLAGGALRGNSEAAVAVLEFSDFQCPYCRRFANETLPDLKRTYIDSGRVLFAFRHFPLEVIHSRAAAAAGAATCAADQGRFWEFHDRLFERPDGLEEPVLEGTAVEVGLSSKAFVDCRADVGSRIRRNIAEATRLGIRSTPTFFIGHVQGGNVLKVVHVISGARPTTDFVRILDGMLLSLQRSP
jgi:protein-disulfide isomerase